MRFAFTIIRFDGNNFSSSDKFYSGDKIPKLNKIPTNFKILIIDNNSDFLKALNFILQKKKINTACANSGYEGVEAINNDKFDLILLDLLMPDLNGAETLEKIKKIKKDHFVVIMTAYPDNQLMKIVRKLGFFGMLHKPFDFADLLKIIVRRINYG